MLRAFPIIATIDLLCQAVCTQHGDVIGVSADCRHIGASTLGIRVGLKRVVGCTQNTFTPAIPRPIKQNVELIDFTRVESRAFVEMLPCLRPIPSVGVRIEFAAFIGGSHLLCRYGGVQLTRNLDLRGSRRPLKFTLPLTIYLL